jgi:hypothetical protein
MYSLVAFFQSVFMVGTTSPPEARRTDTMPDIPDANKIEPRITFDFGADWQVRMRHREDMDAIDDKKYEEKSHLYPRFSAIVDKFPLSEMEWGSTWREVEP